MPRKLYEGGPMGGATDPGLTMGSGMGSGESMDSMMGGGSRPMNPAPKKPAKKRRKRK